MSEYGSMESGAVPGARDSARGPKKLYRFNMSGGKSRSLNHTECDEPLRKIDDELEEAIEKVHERYAIKYLARLRQILKPFNMSNHRIVIDASMGTATLIIISRRTGRPAKDVADLHGNSLVVAQLQEIDQLLEGNWHWTYHLNGKSLNP